MRPISRSISGSFRLPEERASLHSLANVRWGLLVAAILLAAIGLVVVASASATMQVNYLPRQALAVALGLVAMVVLFSLDYQMLLNLAIPIYSAGLALLGLVLVVGHRAGGAQSWLSLGPLHFQPSELAKLTTAILLARLLADADQRWVGGKRVALVVLVVALPMMLVIMERDLGGAVMYLPMVAGMLLVAGIRPRLLALAVVSVVIVCALVWTFALLPYQRDRIATFLNPGRDPLGAGYQVRQSKIAVGSGELTGRGFMRGPQSQLRFLPARHTDFIFSVLAEEWGFLGVITAFGLFGLFIFKGVQVALRARDRAGILLVVGLIAGFAFHVLYNTAMVIGLLPVTGVPLPFLSYGGSFMLLNFMVTGLILGIDFRRYVNR